MTPTPKTTKIEVGYGDTAFGTLASTPEGQLVRTPAPGHARDLAYVVSVALDDDATRPEDYPGGVEALLQRVGRVWHNGYTWTRLLSEPPALAATPESESESAHDDA